MYQYKKILRTILQEGTERKDRTGFGTTSVFSHSCTFDLKRSFPAVTVKPLYFKTMVTETLWFLKGTGNTQFLDENNCKIWKEWTHPELQSVGPMYPAQLRNWNGNIDQLKNLVENIIKDPYSRRHVVSYWNPEVLPDTSHSPIENVCLGHAALAPCHTLFQIYVEDKDVLDILQDNKQEDLQDLHAYLVASGKIDPANNGTLFDIDSDLYDYFSNVINNNEVADIAEFCRDYNVAVFDISLQLYQRSADAYLGVPFNIAQYALLNNIIARVTCTTAKALYITFGDLHLYSNQMEAVEEVMKREPMNLPKLSIKEDLRSLDDFTLLATPDDFELVNYQSHPALAKVQAAI